MKLNDVPIDNKGILYGIKVDNPNHANNCLKQLLAKFPDKLHFVDRNNTYDKTKYQLDYVKEFPTILWFRNDSFNDYGFLQVFGEIDQMNLTMVEVQDKRALMRKTIRRVL